MKSCVCANNQSLYWRGHNRLCPMYAPPLATVARKRRRKILLQDRAFEYGRSRPEKGRKNPNVANVRSFLSPGARKLLVLPVFARDVATAVERSSWYRPASPKPVKRRDRRRPGKPS